MCGEGKDTSKQTSTVRPDSNKCSFKKQSKSFRVNPAKMLTKIANVLKPRSSTHSITIQTLSPTTAEQKATEKKAVPINA